MEDGTGQRETLSTVELPLSSQPLMGAVDLDDPLAFFQTEVQRLNFCIPTSASH